MVLHGALRCAECVGDLSVAAPGRHQAHNLGLAPGQLLARRVGFNMKRAGSSHQSFGHRGLEHSGASSDGTDRREELTIRDVLQEESARTGANAVEDHVGIVKRREDERRRTTRSVSRIRRGGAI